ncbi:uncharacterized protein MELLADRAFT_72630 [Melampsora larici-populina 98AG31]|uniref:D-xylose 1-dehydrogenase (NADP(+), D-xylono-1,5-lactone-forming) n=1 Tax=Melampsora larici-populina (strain 98AG31 / pathotype 3-4-7) TaxID=747676 RepID=F4RWV5_MELLP|nr:uncharacterized protein MELLADRAFT_72630 [Melampsora larici-populina 98AG31]EGG03158.1 hypothetical protein MELLADRAFT_72630 [Melampsora larici-populina 98AG31]
MKSENILRWAVLAPGRIARTFVGDLLTDPATRNVTDISHKLVAVGSRSLDRARGFIDSFEQLKGQDVRAYGSYEELVQDKEVDIVYIASPHNFHHAHSKLSLLAGKNILCEKPMTVNAEQAEDIFRISTEKQLFAMEAVWTRFFPSIPKIQEIIDTGKIGDVLQVQADFGIPSDPKTVPASDRIFNPELAGGGLLDLGAYCWTWLAETLLAQSTLYAKDSQDMSGSTYVSKDIMIPKIKASSVMYRHPEAKPDSLPVDGSTVAILEFPMASGKTIQGIMETSITRPTLEERAVTIYGSTGQIRIPFPTNAPHEFFVSDYIKHTENIIIYNPNPQKPVETRYFYPMPSEGLGYMWEADEAARCIFAKKLESPVVPHRETVRTMKVLDEIRHQIGLVYPPEVEQA